MNKKLIALAAIITFVVLVAGAITVYQSTSIDSNLNETRLSLPRENIMSHFIQKYPTGEFRGEPSLIHSDSKVTAIREPQANGGLCLNLYDTSTLEPLEETEQDANVCNWDESLETEKYIINVSDTRILYYKKGSDRIVIVPESSLLPNSPSESNSETYYEYEDGPNQRADFSFNELENKLTVSIFQRNEPVNGLSRNTKIRSMNFILQ